MFFLTNRTKVETTIGVEPTPSTSSSQGPATPTKGKPGSLPLANGGASTEENGTLTRKRNRDKSPTESKSTTPSPVGAAAKEVSLKGDASIPSKISFQDIDEICKKYWVFRKVKKILAFMFARKP